VSSGWSREEVSLRLEREYAFRRCDHRPDWTHGPSVPSGCSACHEVAEELAGAVWRLFEEGTREEWAVLYERTAMTLETVTQVEHVRDERTAREWVEHRYPPTPTGWNHRAAKRRVTAWEPGVDAE
jgi:hypothetical protein